MNKRNDLSTCIKCDIKEFAGSSDDIQWSRRHGKELLSLNMKNYLINILTEQNNIS